MCMDPAKLKRGSQNLPGDMMIQINIFLSPQRPTKGNCRVNIRAGMSVTMESTNRNTSAGFTIASNLTQTLNLNLLFIRLFKRYIYFVGHCSHMSYWN